MPTQVSVQEVETVNALQLNRRQWLSAHDIQARTSSTAPRTVRSTLTKLTRAGVLEYFEAYPGRRYRLAVGAETEHAAYFAEIAKAAEAFGREGR